MPFSNRMFSTYLILLYFDISITLFFGEWPFWGFILPIKMIRVMSKLSSSLMNIKSIISSFLSAYWCKCRGRLSRWTFFPYFKFNFLMNIKTLALQVKSLITKFTTVWKIASRYWWFIMFYDRFINLRVLRFHSLLNKIIFKINFT